VVVLRKLVISGFSSGRGCILLKAVELYLSLLFRGNERQRVRCLHVCSLAGAAAD